MNVGISDLKETLAVQEYFIKDLENALLVPNDPLKESRLQAMWKDMENFVKKGIALRETNKVAKVTKGANQATNSHIYTSEKSTKTANDVQSTKIVANENAVKQSEQTLRIKLDILNPIKELPYYWRKSQDKLLKLEKRINKMIKSSTFKFLRQVAKDKNKIIINLFDSQNLLGNFQKNYNIFPSTRIYQTNEELILGLINYKYKRKRKMSEDAKDATFIDVFNNFKIKEEEPLDKKEKENRRLAMMNQVDMALKYNNVLKVKQLMNDEDFLLLSDKDKISINLNSRLASLELYEIKQAIEKEKVNKLKLSWEKQVKEENNQADNKTK